MKDAKTITCFFRKLSSTLKIVFSFVSAKKSPSKKASTFGGGCGRCCSGRCCGRLVITWATEKTSSKKASTLGGRGGGGSRRRGRGRLVVAGTTEEATSQQTTTLGGGGCCGGGAGGRRREEEGEQGLEKAEFLLVRCWGRCRSCCAKQTSDAIKDGPWFRSGGDAKHLLDLSDQDSHRNVSNEAPVLHL